MKPFSKGEPYLRNFEKEEEKFINVNNERLAGERPGKGV